MTDDGAQTLTAKSGRSRWPYYTILAVVGLLLVGIISGGLWLDSKSGHRYIISQIEALEPENGLRIEVSSIEGSIFGNAQLIDLALSDPKGKFFTSGKTSLNWNPVAWIFNELNITTVVVSMARLERLPELLKTKEDAPILPEFDIYVGSFRVDNLAIGAAVTGEEQFADLAGAIDIRSGRAMVDLNAETTRSGDNLALMLNAEPDVEKLDIKADIQAPANGAIAKYLGLERDTIAVIDGDGDWKKWDGNLLITGNEQELVALDIAARDGVFGYEGNITADLVPAGLARNLATPRIALNGTLEFADNVVDVDMAARSTALNMRAVGGIDLGKNSLDAMRIESQVRNPSALTASLKAQDLKMKALLNGKFSELRYQYAVES